MTLTTKLLLLKNLTVPRILHPALSHLKCSFIYRLYYMKINSALLLLRCSSEDTHSWTLRKRYSSATINCHEWMKKKKLTFSFQTLLNLLLLSWNSIETKKKRDNKETIITLEIVYFCITKKRVMKRKSGKASAFLKSDWLWCTCLSNLQINL